MSHGKPTNGRCAHTAYQMTCEEFEKLREAAEDRCQICGVPSADTLHGMLHIDHDADLGQWAVRGLLCSPCNTRLGSGSHAMDQARVSRYLPDPWYPDWIAGLGLSLESVAEPPLGSVVKTRGGRAWRHAESGWQRLTRSGRVLDTIGWGALWQKHGPFLRAAGRRLVSAREELLREMTHHHLYMTDERAAELVDAFAHELAEEQRAWAREEGGAEEYGSIENVLEAADLIDLGAVS